MNGMSSPDRQLHKTARFDCRFDGERIRFDLPKCRFYGDFPNRCSTHEDCIIVILDYSFRVLGKFSSVYQTPQYNLRIHQNPHPGGFPSKAAIIFSGSGL